MEKCRFARMVLSALPQMGPIRIQQLEEAMGDQFQHVLGMSEDDLRPFLKPQRCYEVANWRRYFDPEREQALLERWEARFLIAGDTHYPVGLRDLPDRPAGLYVSSSVVPMDRCIAIVGTRHPTQYGRKVARHFAESFVHAGLVVVSGLARGIDTEVHRATLDAGGKTAAILGCGLDQLYPPENRELMEEIRWSAGVWTEFYFGRKADRQTFPQRNRIVSGICSALVVVESGERGGSMITARFALEQGKQVFAVPGRIDQPVSAGCHQLIQDGAHVAFSAESVLEAMKWQPELPGLNLPRPKMVRESNAELYHKLSAEEMAVLGALNEGDLLHPDQVCDLLGLSSARVSTALLLLEIKGLVAKRLDGSFERR